MTNEKDSNVIHNLFAEFHYADDLGVIKSKLAEYVASVRREEREAAFKEAAAILNDFGRELRKVDFLMRLEAAIRTHKQVQLDRVLTEAEIEDPVGVRLTELELQRMDRVEAAASTKGENDG